MASAIIFRAWDSPISTALQAFSKVIVPTPPSIHSFAARFCSSSTLRVVRLRRSMVVRISMVAQIAR
jgi:hypothetical protein